MKYSDLDHNIILETVVGSKMYNLDTPESDTDVKSIFIANPKKYWTLDEPKDTYTWDDPDVASYELKKFCKLALSMNPTILELLYSNEYLRLSPIGKDLVSIRDKFLHKGAINSYMGYALQQVRKNYRNAASVMDYRAGKHIRHVWRLCKQYEQLATTGTLQPRLTDEERAECFAFQELSFEECEKWFEEQDTRLRKLNSVLPDKPDRDAVNKFLADTYERVYHELY